MRFGLMSVMLCAPALCADVYFNDFNLAAGTTYPEWTSSGYSNSANRAGTVAAGSGQQNVATVVSPNGRQRFLGEFGGPVIVAAPPYDPQHFVRVDETVTLTLHDLKPHTFMTVAFDLYVLKRARLKVGGQAATLSSLRNCGYQRRNTCANSLLRTFVRACSKRWAPRNVHCIDCFLTKRRLTT